MRNDSLHMIVLAAIIAIVTTTERWWLFFLLIFLIILSRKQASIPILFCTCVSFIFFYFYTPYYEDLHSTSLSPQTSRFEGAISSQPVVDGDRLSFRMELSDGEQLQIHYKIRSENQQKAFAALSPGILCTFDGSLEKPGQTRNFYSFDYRAFLKSYYGIHWVLRPVEFSVGQCQFQDNFINRLHQYRHEQINKISKDFPDKLSGMVNALLFGDRSGIDETLITHYQSLGLIHLLAVSGLHVGSALGLTFFLLLRFGMTREKGLWGLLGIIPLIIIITGAAPSVLRAGFMAAIVCILSLLRMKIPPINQISIVCFVLLLIKPTYIFHLGFQLSFLITVSILLSSKIILRCKSTLSQLFAASIIAQIASIPIVLWNFYEFSLWSLPLNMILIPLVTLIILPMIFLTFILYSWVPIPVWVVFAKMLELSFSLIHFLMEVSSSLPFGLLTFGRPDGMMMFILIVTLIWFLIRWEKAVSYHKLTTPFFVTIIVFIFLWILPYVDRNGYVTMVDVGQGDAIVVELPFRRGVYVIDSGGFFQFEKERWMERRKSFNTGEDILVPYLKARGIRSINALILTHGHIDHVGGALEVIDSIQVESVLYGKSSMYDNSEEQLLNHIQEKGIPIHLVRDGMKWTTGGQTFKVLGPNQSGTSKNNRSIILYFKLYQSRFLFMGDMEKEQEARFVRSYPNLKIDVLKVGHHGSDTSSTQPFLNHVQPEIALISAGVDNRYQHPALEVINRLAKQGVSIYRTDLDGGIRLKLTPYKTEIETVLNREE
ncbi:DNA internalization-related competence protein ComEC/Rec2 [Alkalihalobacillus sp. AL-G]|uniref:DNA internalization-related competence protein ComEC/Rec2 n=1 Tax=Alkalihalobacillus sp. AL-G TaxID=2926399 RepID=UPI00272CB9E9|nr:DNA internalization-related competence protein ComEC/Rec2 [Alkalihalobacillus sp. AL-G]WLD92146.1 DNA internalization-related competence protein ComEC/Rec2 [Alkalihalobacillus sp. AL-G]